MYIAGRAIELSAKIQIIYVRRFFLEMYVLLLHITFWEQHSAEHIQ